MLSKAKWIWLDESPRADVIALRGGYCVAEVSKAYRLLKTAVRLRLEVSADTSYKLWVNGKFVGTGPSYPMDKMSFYSEYELSSAPDTLEIRALVRRGVRCETESSHGVGGFILSCDIEYDDGTLENVCTDEKWDIRYLPSHISDTETDFTLAPCDWEKATEVHYPAALAKSPVAPLFEQMLEPPHQKMYVCPGHAVSQFCVAFPAMYSAFPAFSADGGDYEITLEISDGEGSVARTESIHAYGRIDYVSDLPSGVSAMIINVVNNGADDVKIFDAHLIRSLHKTVRKASFSCSDRELDSIWNRSMSTLENCRRDSFCESPSTLGFMSALADVREEALYSQIAFGDATLARCDILKIAERIINSGAELNNSVGLLSFLPMIWDYYSYTGDESIFAPTEEACELLLSKFDTYLSDAKIIETPPDFAPVDKIKIGSYSLENPPKALGQAFATASFFKALDIMSKIYAERGNNKLRSAYRLRADAVKKGFETAFTDRDSGLCLAGLTTKNKKPGRYPKNTAKKYYTRQAATVMALYGLCDSSLAKQLAIRALSDKALCDVSPAFTGNLLELSLRLGLFEKYGLGIIRRWGVFGENSVGRTWNGDGYGYGGGASPAYYLPVALAGLEVVRPGFAEVRLAPRLYGLDSANISIPTPYGYITVNMEKGRPAEISIPDEIKYTIV